MRQLRYPIRSRQTQQRSTIAFSPAKLVHFVHSIALKKVRAWSLPFAFSVGFLGFSALAVSAGNEWVIQRLAADVDDTSVFAESRQRAPGGLPDGLITAYEGRTDILKAWYTEPTTRYGHGILGDRIEAGTLNVRLPNGNDLSLKLSDTEVFEDRYPRLADLDGDGSTEVITIRSSLSAGASVTVYGLRDGALIEKATTGFIGRSNRWLNIAGIARFFGRKTMEIAFVRTPHIGGTLFIHRFENGRLRQVASLDGFSNHQIGSREMRLSAIADVNGNGRMELALPSDSRAVLRIVGISEGNLIELGSVDLAARIDKAIGVKGTGNSTRFIVGLDNSEVYEISQKGPE